jgi:hypothetical protein
MCIYDSTTDVVYVGYTPGYMGCYVHGPTVVYGTGYYYSPWYGPYYYPRPATFSFSMHYNPWTGWSMWFHYSAIFLTLAFTEGVATGDLPFTARLSIHLIAAGYMVPGARYMCIMI